ncbi:MAG: SRPBCC domain-containing protein [Acidimicrobiales bacterium]
MSSTQPNQTQPDQLVREVELSAPGDVVWAVLTDPDELAEWLGGEVDLTLEPGSVGRVTDPDGTVRQVLVTDVEPGRRLGWHWWSDDELSSVELVVEPIDGDRTRIRVTETVTADVEPSLIDGFSPLLGGTIGDALGGGFAGGPIAPQASVRSLALAGV